MKEGWSTTLPNRLAERGFILNDGGQMKDRKFASLREKEFALWSFLFYFTPFIFLLYLLFISLLIMVIVIVTRKCFKIERILILRKKKRCEYYNTIVCHLSYRMTCETSGITFEKLGLSHIAQYVRRTSILGPKIRSKSKSFWI